jgi:hypothetical protein
LAEEDRVAIAMRDDGLIDAIRVIVWRWINQRNRVIFPLVYLVSRLGD